METTIQGSSLIGQWVSHSHAYFCFFLPCISLIYMLCNRLMHIKQQGATIYSVQALSKPTIG